jgi:hypothetical protein
MAPETASTTVECPFRAAHCAPVVRLVHVTPAAERARHLKPIELHRNRARAAARRRRSLLIPPDPAVRPQRPYSAEAYTRSRAAHAHATHARRCFAEGTAKPHKVPRTDTNARARIHNDTLTKPTHAPPWKLQHARTQTRAHTQRSSHAQKDRPRDANTHTHHHVHLHAHPRTTQTHTQAHTQTHARTRTRTVNARS